HAAAVDPSASTLPAGAASSPRPPRSDNHSGPAWLPVASNGHGVRSIPRQVDLSPQSEVGPMSRILFVTQRSLGRLLAAAAFVAVVATSGCSVCPNLHSADATDRSGPVARRNKVASKQRQRARDPWPDQTQTPGGGEV